MRCNPVERETPLCQWQSACRNRGTASKPLGVWTERIPFGQAHEHCVTREVEVASSSQAQSEFTPTRDTMGGHFPAAELKSDAKTDSGWSPGATP